MLADTARKDRELRKDLKKNEIVIAHKGGLCILNTITGEKRKFVKL
jgi:hypothetical protein